MIASDFSEREGSASGQESHGSAGHVAETKRTPGSLMTRLEMAIETERRNLSKAEAVLGCLAIAMEERPEQDSNSPYYPDVAEVVLDMVRRSVDQLDCTNLARAMVD